MHDPNIGVNSETDPMYGFTFHSDASPAAVGGDDTPWGEIVLIAAIAAVVVIVIVVGLAGVYALARRGKPNEYESLDIHS